MKLAILGGSFNPVHLGHLFLAEEVLAQFHYDRLIFVPAYRSPFKLSAREMEGNSKDRLEMLAAAIAADPRLSIDDCELKREGVSYTVDTLRDIIRRYAPTGKPALVIGDDLAQEFAWWHKSSEIVEIADIIIARRVKSAELSLPFPYQPLTNEVMPISSKMIRQRIAEGKTWHYLVPAAARVIIEERGLYTQGKRNNMAAVIVSVEDAARKELSAGRFIHSRNTALLAWDLCRRFGIDPSLGYLAGIAHDLAKPLSEKVLIKLAKSDGSPFSKLEKKKPALLHGRAAAVLLRQRFNIHDKDILDAVAKHTEGGVGMGPLAKIVYIADKLEVSREKVDPALRALCYNEKELDRIFWAVVDHTVSWLQGRAMDVSDETLILHEKMKKKYTKAKEVNVEKSKN